MKKGTPTRDGKVPTKAVREYLKRTGKSIVDINWQYLKPGVMVRLVHEEVIRNRKIEKDMARLLKRARIKLPQRERGRGEMQ